MQIPRIITLLVVCWTGVLCVASGAGISLGELACSRAELDSADGEWVQVALPVRLEGQYPPVLRFRIAVVWLAGGDGKELLFTESSVKVAGVGTGQQRIIFHYLHPDVVRAHKLQPEPLAWWISVSDVQGAQLAEARAPFIRDAERFANFLSRHHAAEETHPYLLPIFRTPFYSEGYPERLEASPAYLWD